MSALEVSDRHIAYLALAWAHYRRRLSVCTFSWEIEDLARMLKHENRASVAHLYARDNKPCPGCGEIVCDWRPTYRAEVPAEWVRVSTDRGVGRVCPFAVVKILGANDYGATAAEVFDSVKVIKQAKFYAYQSCEHPEWETSRAKEIADGIITDAIGALPGYDSAPWGLS